jgi:SAM-dependent methyltransferase
MAIEVDPERERAELREYLGSRYDPARLEQYDRVLEAEFAACGDEARFYRTSEAYLYNLTAFAMSLTKLPYLNELAAHVEPAARVLDYGCGIGSDGLALLEAGYRVEFADFGNPSVEYLSWRLERRGLEAPIHDLDEGVPGGFDAAFSFDVIEHVDDPAAFLDELDDRATLVAVNLLEPVPGESDLHRALPTGSLLRRIARRRLVSYRFLHDRSHLVLYSPRRGGPLARLKARAAIRAELRQPAAR